MNIVANICKDFFLQESSASIPWQVAGRHRHLCSLGGWNWAMWKPIAGRARDAWCKFWNQPTYNIYTDTSTTFIWIHANKRQWWAFVLKHVRQPIPFHPLSLDQSTLLYVGHIRGIAAEVDVLAANRGDQPRRGPHASKLQSKNGSSWMTDGIGNMNV